jgi:hypothetical protein
VKRFGFLFGPRDSHNLTSWFNDIFFDSTCGIGALPRGNDQVVIRNGYCVAVHRIPADHPM